LSQHRGVDASLSQAPQPTLEVNAQRIALAQLIQIAKQRATQDSAVGAQRVVFTLGIARQPLTPLAIGLIRRTDLSAQRHWIGHTPLRSTQALVHLQRVEVAHAGS
jgi:hypothetical protein